MNLKRFTDEELLEELERRKEKKLNTPKRKSNIDWSGVLKLCDEHIETIAKNGDDGSFDHWIYEGVMDAIYGRQVWSWINSK